MHMGADGTVKGAEDPQWLQGLWEASVTPLEAGDQGRQ